MTVRVKKFRVNTGEAVYSEGEVIKNLSKEDEKKLVDEGICELVIPWEDEPPIQTGNLGEDTEGNHDEDLDSEENSEEGPETSLPTSSSTKKANSK